MAFFNLLTYLASWHTVILWSSVGVHWYIPLPLELNWNVRPILWKQLWYHWFNQLKCNTCLCDNNKYFQNFFLSHPWHFFPSEQLLFSTWQVGKPIPVLYNAAADRHTWRAIQRITSCQTWRSRTKQATWQVWCGLRGVSKKCVARPWRSRDTRVIQCMRILHVNFRTISLLSLHALLKVAYSKTLKNMLTTTNHAM